MSGFTERSVHRALGTAGRIHPRIVPVLALEPWGACGSPTGLELSEEVGARLEREPTLPHAAVASPEPAAGSSSTRGSERPRDPRATVIPAPPVERRSSVVRPIEPVEGPMVSPRATLERAASDVVPSRTLERAVTSAVAPQPTYRSDSLMAMGVGTSALRGDAQARDDDPPSDRVVRLDEAPRPHSLPLPRSAKVDSSKLDGIAVKPWRVDGPSFAAPPTSGSRSAPQPYTASVAAEPASPWVSEEPAFALVPGQPARHGAAETSEPVVRIDIGRVEVRAPPSAPPARPSRIGKPGSFVSLAQYLHGRGRA